MPHQLPTDLTNETTGLLEGTAMWATEVTNGMWWAFMLIGFCVVLWISASRYGQARAFGYATVVGLFGGIILGILGFIPWWITSAFVITGAIGLVSMIMQEK